MPLSLEDVTALWLTAKLAGVTTGLLLVLATPLAWWLARSRSRWRAPVSAIVALPLVLPPTVLGFYLLVAMGPAGPVGKLTTWLGIDLLPFTFSGLVIGSLIYSLPFVVQPLRNAFAAIDPDILDAAATLGASPLDRFCSVALRLARPGYLAAGVLGFAHTVGEFGVVLMIGGSIPGETRLVSVQIYDHAESLSFASAHALSIVLVMFAFIALSALYWLGPRQRTASVGL
ncbi:MAG: molybdate ABC transporter permease subunit [Pseudomonadota bacterium]